MLDIVNNEGAATDFAAAAENVSEPAVFEQNNFVSADEFGSADEIIGEEGTEEDAEKEVGEVEGAGEENSLSLTARVSSLLFVSNRPLSLRVLSEACVATEEEILKSLDDLKALVDEEQLGFRIIEIGGTYQFRTGVRAAKTVKKLIPARAKRLSKAAAETLAVVAYRQPVQRAEIEAIRGVDALPTLKTLLEARLVRIVGREEVPGQPALYGTTPIFLEKFGLKDLSELPSIRELKQFQEEPGEFEVNETDVDDENAGGDGTGDGEEE